MTTGSHGFTTMNPALGINYSLPSSLVNIAANRVTNTTPAIVNTVTGKFTTVGTTTTATDVPAITSTPEPGISMQLSALRSAATNTAALLSQGLRLSVTAEPAGVLSTQQLGAAVLNFEDLPLGGVTTHQFNGVIMTGVGGVIANASLTPGYAVPAHDMTKFLVVSYPAANGNMQFVFSKPQTYFGLYWGSIESYNSISFLKRGVVIQTFTGLDVANLTNLTASGNPFNDASNRYINFGFENLFYDEVILSTVTYNFEVDNIAFADLSIAGKTPATIAANEATVFLNQRVQTTLTRFVAPPPDTTSIPN